MVMKKENLALALSLRHELHAHPELSAEEVWTRAHLKKFLKKHTNLEIVDRGLWFYAYYHAGDDLPTIAFRADFDALPLEDEIDKPYRSQFRGIAHKCGHDGHAACLAGLCLEIDQNGANKNIVFIFQHAEEIGEGGQPASAAIFEKDVQEVYAFHNYTGGPPFTIITHKGDGVTNCASVAVCAFFQGKVSHASEPEKGVNPVFALSEMALKVGELKVQHHWPKLALATIVGLEVGGDDLGISPDSGVIRITLRAERDAELEMIVQEVEQIAQELADKYGVSLHFEYRDAFPESFSHEIAAAKMRKAGDDLGFAHSESEDAIRGSEDFGWYTKLIPGSMLSMCADGPEIPLHSDHVDFDDKLIEPVVSIFVKSAEYPVEPS
jgi:amidohydrolase